MIGKLQYGLKNLYDIASWFQYARSLFAFFIFIKEKINNHYDTYAAKVEFIIKCKVYFP